MRGLHFKGNGADRLAATFVREGQRTSKRALRHMRRVSKMVMETSIAMSPIDTGELEDAHHLVEEVGANRRIEVTIEVGGTVNGVDVDKYAEYIHHGSWSNLGPRSAQKNASSPVTVGKYFLVRALEQHEDELDDALLDELVEGLLG